MYYYNLGKYFKAIAKEHAQLSALRYAEREHTYAELYNHSQRLIQVLLQEGCKKGDVIAIGNTKRVLSYSLMLAALQIGVAYINIDVTSPIERTKRILDVAKPLLIFYDDPNLLEEMEKLADATQCNLRALDENTLPVLDAEMLTIQGDLVNAVDGACIAYIMYTSGSTGIPKGVAVTHANLTHFIAWAQNCFSVKTSDIFANLSPMYFDNSVFDFYSALFSGASLVPISKEMLNQPYELIPFVDKMSCSIWFCVPSLLMYLMSMKAFSLSPLKTIRSISFGGEGYPKIELKKLYDMFHQTAQLVNVYGPTECTCICSAHKLGEEDFASLDGLPTLGKLNQNFDYMILDEDSNESTNGELCLIGPNVAAGYYNDEERTSKSFFTLTTPNRYMKRMYKTGDLVREETGKLFFIGRKDNQIKHMGYRIELEEIENALISFSKINQAAAIYNKESLTHGKILAFCASQNDIDVINIKNYIETLLPTYMMPHKIYILDKLPVNANGKVDKQALMLKI